MFCTLLSLGGTLPFDDSIPSRSELRTRGFFKSLEKAGWRKGMHGNLPVQSGTHEIIHG